MGRKEHRIPYLISGLDGSKFYRGRVGLVVLSGTPVTGWSRKRLKMLAMAAKEERWILYLLSTVMLRQKG